MGGGQHSWAPDLNRSKNIGWCGDNGGGRKIGFNRSTPKGKKLVYRSRSLKFVFQKEDG